MMDNLGKIYEGNIFPITENGMEKIYVTNADYETITSLFLDSNNLNEFIESIKEKGCKINIYNSSIQLNFDEK